MKVEKYIAIDCSEYNSKQTFNESESSIPESHEMRPNNRHNSLFHMNEPLLFKRHNIIECCRNGSKINPAFVQNQEAKMLIKSLTELQN